MWYYITISLLYTWCIPEPQTYIWQLPRLSVAARSLDARLAKPSLLFAHSPTSFLSHRTHAPCLPCRYLTKYPHIAGSENNHKLALTIHDRWSTYNFDKVELVNYTVYLSYPNQSNPNVLLLQNSSGDVVYNASTAQEPPLTPGENDSDVAHPFNAYSGLGNASVSGRIIWCKT